MHEAQGVSLGFRRAGPHLLRIERPDVLFMQLHGQVELEHFLLFHRVMAEIRPPTRIYLLRDARNGGFVTPEARAFISRHEVIDRIEAVVSFGATFQARTVATMMNRAMKSFHTREPDIAFFDDEGSARKWIDNHRKQFS